MRATGRAAAPVGWGVRALPPVAHPAHPAHPGSRDRRSRVSQLGSPLAHPARLKRPEPGRSQSRKSQLFCREYQSSSQNASKDVPANKADRSRPQHGTPCHQMTPALGADGVFYSEKKSDNSCHFRPPHRTARPALEMLNGINQRLELEVAVPVGAGIQRLPVWMDE